jgi:hypothetical protein
MIYMCVCVCVCVRVCVRACAYNSQDYGVFGLCPLSNRGHAVV